MAYNAFFVLKKKKEVKPYYERDRKTSFEDFELFGAYCR